MSPNREISMAPVSVMPRLGFWSSINPPGAGAGRATLFSSLFALSLRAMVLRKRYRFCSYAQGFSGNVVARKAMCKGFKEIVCGFCTSCCYVQGFYRKCAALTIMCKGFMEM